MIICQLQYARSHAATAWPKSLSVFLKAKGANAKTIDLLHSVGITMSNSWSLRAYRKISEDNMKQTRLVVRRFPYRIGFDNLNIPFRVGSQRLTNKSHFDSSTVASVFYKRHAPPEPPLSLPNLMTSRKAGRENPLSMEDILRLDLTAAPILCKRKIRQVLQYLIDSPAFAFHSYPHRNNSVFKPLAAVEQLPYGPKHITKQCVLGTVKIDESSYEGVDMLIKEFLNQLSLYTRDELVKTGLERVIPWIGDQLSSERLTGLINYRGEDRNGFDRLDWILAIFGWFHFLMTLATSIHKQHFGTTAGRGLRYAFGLLKRTGLQMPHIKGEFYHHLREGLYHVSEAHFRSTWTTVANVEDLSELRSKTPAELWSLAEKIVRHHASTEALEDHDLQPEDLQDDVYRNTTMFQRDVLYYILLDNAVKIGDIGLMEHLLPHCFIRFCGTNNHKYAVEILNLLQGLHREWTPEVRYI